MRILKVYFLIAFLVGFHAHSNCQTNQMKASPLNGTWIEASKKSDTIVFASSYDGQHATFELKRGFRMAEGYKLPDYFSGSYWYKVSFDSISLYWFLSSGSFQSYYFRKIPGENKFMIGNFFKDPEKKKIESDTLVFIKLL